jgi:hypothetical protein
MPGGLASVKAAIAEMTVSRVRVRFEDIESVVSHLAELGHQVAVFDLPGGDGKLFRIARVAPFSVLRSPPGVPFVRERYVKSFLDAMVDLGLFE